MWITWRRAMESALYGPDGFYSSGEPPARHFRTSVHVSPRFAGALLGLLRTVDAALGCPGRLDLVDVGAGRGELLAEILRAAAPDEGLMRRLVPQAVEIMPRPGGLDPRIRWRARLPAAITGMVVANEWLDNVPLDIAEFTRDGPRLMLVDPASGLERPGPRPGRADTAWLREWWPLRAPGDRAEIGRPRCLAWARVIRRLDRGLALAIDYWHEKGTRPPGGTLMGYQLGRAVRAVPDGSRDITAHVALDACARAGRAAGAGASLLTTQRALLRSLGISGSRPPLALAASDPLGYARALSECAQEGALLDPEGLGGFGCLAQTAGTGLPAAMTAARPATGAPPLPGKHRPRRRRRTRTVRSLPPAPARPQDLAAWVGG